VCNDTVNNFKEKILPLQSSWKSIHFSKNDPFVNFIVAVLLLFVKEGISLLL
jgi:hypothetical protein